MSSLSNKVYLSNQAFGIGAQVTENGDYFAIRMFKSSSRNLLKDVVIFEWYKADHKITISNYDSSGNLISRDNITTTSVI